MGNIIKCKKTYVMDESLKMETLTMDTVIIMDTQDLGVSKSRLNEFLSIFLTYCFEYQINFEIRMQILYNNEKGVAVLTWTPRPTARSIVWLWFWAWPRLHKRVSGCGVNSNCDVIANCTWNNVPLSMAKVVMLESKNPAKRHVTYDGTRWSPNAQAIHDRHR